MEAGETSAAGYDADDFDPVACHQRGAGKLAGKQGGGVMLDEDGDLCELEGLQEGEYGAAGSNRVWMAVKHDSGGGGGHGEYQVRNSGPHGAGAPGSRQAKMTVLLL